MKITAADILAALASMTPAERAEIRRLLGVAGDYRKAEIDSRTGEPKPGKFDKPLD
jgi:hypothetical protein